MIEELREKIKDYYGVIMQTYPGAMGEYFDVDSMSDEKVIEEAKKLHII